MAELEKSPGDYVTIYVKPSSFPCYINELSLQSKYSVCIPEIKELANMEAVFHGVERYKSGAAIFWQERGNKHLLLPPFPISENRVSLGELDTSILYETLERKYTIGVVLVTWGSYAVGVFHGDNLVDSKVGTGYIHKKHKKGAAARKDLPEELRSKKGIS